MHAFWFSAFFIGAALCAAAEISWENVQVLSGHGKNYTYKLEKDAQKFVHQVTKWTRHIVGKDAAHQMTLNYHFTVKNKDLASKEKPCGDLLIHRIFPILEMIMDAPQIANFSINAARLLSWHPSHDCLRHHGFQAMDGGAGAGFEVLCDKKVLMKAGGGGGGVLFHLPGLNDHEHSDLIGGSAVSINMLDGALEIAGGVTGPWSAGLIKSVVPENPMAPYHQVQNEMKECGDKLVVKGSGGGGWKEKHGDSSDEVGYGFSFELHSEHAPSPPPVVASPSVQPTQQPKSSESKETKESAPKEVKPEKEASSEATSPEAEKDAAKPDAQEVTPEATAPEAEKDAAKPDAQEVTPEATAPEAEKDVKADEKQAPSEATAPEAEKDVKADEKETATAPETKTDTKPDEQEVTPEATAPEAEKEAKPDEREVTPEATSPQTQTDTKPEEKQSTTEATAPEAEKDTKADEKVTATAPEAGEDTKPAEDKNEATAPETKKDTKPEEKETAPETQTDTKPEDKQAATEATAPEAEKDTKLEDKQAATEPEAEKDTKPEEKESAAAPETEEVAKPENKQAATEATAPEAEKDTKIDDKQAATEPEAEEDTKPAEDKETAPQAEEDMKPEDKQVPSEATAPETDMDAKPEAKENQNEATEEQALQPNDAQTAPEADKAQSSEMAVENSPAQVSDKRETSEAVTTKDAVSLSAVPNVDDVDVVQHVVDDEKTGEREFFNASPDTLAQLRQESRSIQERFINSAIACPEVPQETGCVASQVFTKNLNAAEWFIPSMALNVLLRPADSIPETSSWSWGQTTGVILAVVGVVGVVAIGRTMNRRRGYTHLPTSN